VTLFRSKRSGVRLVTSKQRRYQQQTMMSYHDLLKQQRHLAYKPTRRAHSTSFIRKQLEKAQKTSLADVQFSDLCPINMPRMLSQFFNYALLMHEFAKAPEMGMKKKMDMANRESTVSITSSGEETDEEIIDVLRKSPWQEYMEEKEEKERKANQKVTVGFNNMYVLNVLASLMEILQDGLKGRSTGYFWNREIIPRTVCDLFDAISAVRQTGVMDEFLSLSCVYLMPYITERQKDMLFLKFLFQRKCFLYLVKELLDDSVTLNQLFGTGSFLTLASNHYPFMQICAIMEKMEYDFNLFPPKPPKGELDSPKGLVEEFGTRVCDIHDLFLRKKNTLIYSLKLPVIMMRSAETGKIPAVITEMMTFIKTKAIDVEGIFRISGGKSQVMRWKNKIDESSYNLRFAEDIKDVHVVAALLKEFFRMMPEPLMTYALFDQFLEVARVKTLMEKVLMLKDLIGLLSVEHQCLLKRLLKMLVFVAKNESVNKMGTKNLAIVWGANIIRTKSTNPLMMLKYSGVVASVTQTMIENYETLKVGFVKKVIFTKAEVVNPNKIHKWDWDVLKQIGNEVKNGEIRLKVRDGLLHSLLCVMEHRMKHSMFSNVFFLDLLQAYVRDYSDLVFSVEVNGKPLSLSALLQSVDEYVETKRPKRIRYTLKSIYLFCLCINHGVLKELLWSVFSCGLLSKYYETDAIVMDNSLVQALRMHVETLCELPFIFNMKKI